jgi:hypothetical protein
MLSLVSHPELANPVHVALFPKCRSEAEAGLVLFGASSGGCLETDNGDGTQPRASQTKYDRDYYLGEY